MQLTELEKKVFSKMGTESRRKQFAGKSKEEISSMMSDLRKKGLKKKKSLN